MDLPLVNAETFSFLDRTGSTDLFEFELVDVDSGAVVVDLADSSFTVGLFAKAGLSAVDDLLDETDLSTVADLFGVAGLSDVVGLLGVAGLSGVAGLLGVVGWYYELSE